MERECLSETSVSTYKSADRYNTLKPRKWRQYVHPKRWCLQTSLQKVTTHFSPEDVDTMFIRNIGINLWVHTASQHRITIQTPYRSENINFEAYLSLFMSSYVNSWERMIHKSDMFCVLNLFCLAFRFTFFECSVPFIWLWYLYDESRIIIDGKFTDDVVRSWVVRMMTWTVTWQTLYCCHR
jgi:hypothetical protein